MDPSIEDRVIDYYRELFGRIFSEPARRSIGQRLRRDAVVRQIEEVADAASQSLTRFFVNQVLSDKDVELILEGFADLADRLNMDDLANPNVPPESVVADLLNVLPCPEALQRDCKDPHYRLALHSVVQVLMRVAPVMREWGKLNFSTTFELHRRIVTRLNKISEQMDAFGRKGTDAAGERYELSYRDYLMQRFHRVEAGTVRMTTNLDVDLRQLFVMPKIRRRPARGRGDDEETLSDAALMSLAAARKFFGHRSGFAEREESEEKEKETLSTALEQIRRYPLNVFVGAPGVGKSTFLEWLQIKLASVEEELVLGGQQAIPLLLRVRQLDPRNLPHGLALIEKATASLDRAALMPPGWIDRQMEAGRVLFMLDGLDETDPAMCDECLLPWLVELCTKYPDCRYLVSSRPAGYPPGTLRRLQFAECDLLDFEEPQVREYTRHWCTAVRLARNEPEEEARREGKADGDRIVEGFKKNPYICDLARNPLMLSAVCLVNYFEGGQLPEDRAKLYKLCVEGLMHNWDQRRGIHSDFAFEEKLRACREVALAMQAQDRAEVEKGVVQAIFADVLRNGDRAENLLEHIRIRTGLLLERRPGVFAFAHLTFQEYLAALAVHEGNRLRVDADRLAAEHDDGRWQEVISLYCGLAPAPAARAMLRSLIQREDTFSLGHVLADAYLSAGAEIAEDRPLRQEVLERITVAPASRGMSVLYRFPDNEVAPICNRLVGKIKSPLDTSAAHRFLQRNPEFLDMDVLNDRLREWPNMLPLQRAELFHLFHAFAPDDRLADMASSGEPFESEGPKFGDRETYSCQAEIALFGLARRARKLVDFHRPPGFEAALRRIMSTLLMPKNKPSLIGRMREIERIFRTPWIPQHAGTPSEFVALAHEFADCLTSLDPAMSNISIELDRDRKDAVIALRSWAIAVENAIQAEGDRPLAEGKNKAQGQPPTKGPGQEKKTGKRGKRK